MSNSLATTNGKLVIPDNKQATLLDIRMDSKTYPRLKTYAPETANSIMALIVLEAHRYKGIVADATNIKFIASALVEELQADRENLGTSNLTFAEISRAIKKAILTTDIYGISVATLYKVIIDWIKTEGIQLQKEANCKYVERRKAEIDKSPIAPMLNILAGAMIRRSK